MSKKPFSPMGHEAIAFQSAMLVQGYCQRIADVKQKLSTLTFKAGTVQIVRASSKGDNLIVSYKIEGRSYSVELGPNDPRHDPKRFKAWLENECKERTREQRRKQAQQIARGGY